MRSQTPNGVWDSSAADAARIPYVGHQGTGLERRPIVKRRDAAAKPAFLCSQIRPIDKTLVSWSELGNCRNLNTPRGLGRPKISNLQNPALKQGANENVTDLSPTL